MQKDRHLHFFFIQVSLLKRKFPGKVLLFSISYRDIFFNNNIKFMSDVKILVKKTFTKSSLSPPWKAARSLFLHYRALCEQVRKSHF